MLFQIKSPVLRAFFFEGTCWKSYKFNKNVKIIWAHQSMSLLFLNNFEPF